jgi:predicted PurR-regulated permease PerM
MTSRLEAGAGEVASRSAMLAGLVASGTFSAILGLLFALLTMYAVLRHWPRIVSAVVIVSPLNGQHTRAVLHEFQRAGRATLAGTVVTGLAQGILAGVGFWIFGVPQPAFFGAATAVASLMPGIGTLLIWVPAGVYLFVTGHAPKAILELVWCALLVVGLSDYVIRPRLVGDSSTPAILVFIALFGGLEMLGLQGPDYGPHSHGARRRDAPALHTRSAARKREHVARASDLSLPRPSARDTRLDGPQFLPVAGNVHFGRRQQLSKVRL